MASRSVFGIRAHHLLLAGALGAVAPDTGHFLNIITSGQVSWDYFHNLGGLFAGLLVASIFGLAATVGIKR